MADKFQYVYVDPDQSSNACHTGTPLNSYTDDMHYCSESVNICQWVAKRLGHPVMQLEFNSASIYAVFEESIHEYSTQVNNYNMKNWYWSQYANTSASISGSVFSGSAQKHNPIHPTMGTTVTLSETYGENAGVGGNANLYSASITLESEKQNYDLQNAFSASVATHTELSGSSNKRIVVQQVFNSGPAAISKFYDPMAGSYDQRNMIDAFGFGSYSPSTTFIMRPLYYDVLRSQAIESSDYIRKSNYSFQINNNQVKIFPIPDSGDAGKKVWFQYYIYDDLNDINSSYTEDKVSDPSNVPFTFIKYHTINGPGRQWIRKYTLALAKELLGIIRSKYASMPLPNGEVTMDGEQLKGEGREEKDALLTELREFLEGLSNSEQARMEQERADANQAVLNKSPLGIYLG